MHQHESRVCQLSFSRPTSGGEFEMKERVPELVAQLPWSCAYVRFLQFLYIILRTWHRCTQPSTPLCPLRVQSTGGSKILAGSRGEKQRPHLVLWTQGAGNLVLTETLSLLQTHDSSAFIFALSVETLFQNTYLRTCGPCIYPKSL